MYGGPFFVVPAPRVITKHSTFLRLYRRRLGVRRLLRRRPRHLLRRHLHGLPRQARPLQLLRRALAPRAQLELLLLPLQLLRASLELLHRPLAVQLLRVTLKLLQRQLPRQLRKLPLLR